MYISSPEQEHWKVGLLGQLLWATRNGAGQSWVESGCNLISCALKSTPAQGPVFQSKLSFLCDWTACWAIIGSRREQESLRQGLGDGIGFCHKLYGEVRIGASSWKVPKIFKEGGRAV